MYDFIIYIFIESQYYKLGKALYSRSRTIDSICQVTHVYVHHAIIDQTLYAGKLNITVHLPTDVSNIETRL